MSGVFFGAFSVLFGMLIILFAYRRPGYLSGSHMSAILFIIGVIIIGFAMMQMKAIIVGSKSYICLYDSYLEGVKHTAFLLKRKTSYRFQYDQISNFQPVVKSKLATPCLAVMASGVTYKLPVKDITEIMDILNRKTNR